MRQAQAHSFTHSIKAFWALHKDKFIGNRCRREVKLRKTRGRGGLGREKSDKVVVVSLCQHSVEIAQLWSGRRVEGHGQCSDLVTSGCMR